MKDGGRRQKGGTLVLQHQAAMIFRDCKDEGFFSQIFNI